MDPSERFQIVSAKAVRMALAATSRTEIGKHVSQLRKSGRIPAIVFGHGIDSIPVSLDAHEFDHIRRAVHSNTIVELKIDDKTTHSVLIHGVQINPRNRQLLHVDLFELKSGEEVTVEVPLHASGESYAVARLGGTLLHNIDHVRVRALPDKLPESLDYTIDSLVDFEKAIHLRDLPLPAGVTLLSDPDEVVAKVAAPKVEEVAVPEAAAEAAAEAPAADAKPEA
jgi:large subunit ribosomal protein L25